MATKEKVLTGYIKIYMGRNDPYKMPFKGTEKEILEKIDSISEKGFYKEKLMLIKPVMIHKIKFFEEVTK